jgi:hypothetical protein
MRSRRNLLAILVALVLGAPLLGAGPAPDEAAADPVVAPVTCAATGPMTPRGSVTVMLGPIPFAIPLAQLGQPVADALGGAELPLPLPVDLDATAAIEPGGRVDYAGGVRLDLGAEVAGVVAGVRDAIAAAGYPTLADTLSLRAALEDLTVELPHPTGTTGTGTPVATGTGVGARHHDGALLVTVDELVVASDSGVSALDTDLGWSVVDGGTQGPAVLDQRLGGVTFTLDVGVGGTVPGDLVAPFVPEAYQGLVPEDVPVTAGARGPWACTPDDPPPVLASTTVLAAPEPCATGFTDVGPTHRFCTEIAWAAGGGLVVGWPDGTFRPTVAVSRQAMAAILHRRAGSPEPPGGAPTFPDVPSGHRFEDGIRWLAAEGITTGYDDGTFGPTRSISRQAMAAMLHRLAGEPAVPGDAPTFPDVPSGHRFEDEIRWLAAEGITAGYDDGRFRPEAPVSRQAAVAMLHRMAP